MPIPANEKEKFVKQVADAMENDTFISGIGVADKMAKFPHANSLANQLVSLRKQLRGGKITQQDFDEQVKQLMEI
jgi:hypothetical protein